MTKIVGFCFLILSLCLPGFTFSGRDKVESADVQPVEVVGLIGVYGNEPNTWLGFIDTQGVEYALDATPQMLRELRNLQGILVKLTGFLKTVPEGQFAGFQTLSGGTIEIVEYTVHKE